MADDERGADDAGWAAPHLPPRDPAEGAPAPGAPPPPPPPAPPPPPDAPPPSAAWAQPAPAPGVAAPPGPARRRRGWLVTLFAVLGVFLVAIVLGTVFFVSSTLPPYDAANDFVNDLADGRFRAAADQLCAADRNDSDTAISVVTRHFPGNDRVSVNPFGVDRDGDHATVDYTVSRERGSDSVETFELTLREEDGDWRPCPGDSVRLR